MLKCNFAIFSIWQASTWQTGVGSTPATKAIMASNGQEAVLGGYQGEVQVVQEVTGNKIY